MLLLDNPVTDCHSATQLENEHLMWILYYCVKIKFIKNIYGYCLNNVFGALLRYFTVININVITPSNKPSKPDLCKF